MMLGTQEQVATSKYALDLHDATLSRVNPNLWKSDLALIAKYPTKFATTLLQVLHMDSYCRVVNCLQIYTLASSQQFE